MDASPSLPHRAGTVLIALAAVGLLACIGVVAAGGGDGSLAGWRITIRSLNLPLQQFVTLSLLGALLRRRPRTSGDDAWFSQPRHYNVALLALMLASCGVRCAALGVPPLDFHPVRQYFDLHLARALHDGTTSSAAHGEIEPPVIEALTQPLYAVSGGEPLWASRLVAIVGFLIGVPPLFLWLRDRAGPDLALTSAALYLFLPYSLLAGSSYQPDPLMLSLLLWFGWSFERMLASQRPRHATEALFFATLAIFVKLPAVLFATALLISMAAERGEVGRLARSVKFWICAGVATLPALASMLTRGGHGDAPGLDYYLQQRLLLTPAFYLHAWDMLKDCYTPIGLVITAAGVWMTRGRPLGSVMRGFLGGQLLYAIIFPFHVSTHSYYSLPLLPVVAMAGAVVTHALTALKKGTTAWLTLLCVGSACGWLQSIQAAHLDRLAARYQTIGAAVGGASTLFIARDYGLPLTWHGHFAGTSFEPDELAEADIVSALEARLHSGRPALLIIEDATRLDAHPALRDYLFQRWPSLTVASALPRTEQWWVLRLSPP